MRSSSLIAFHRSLCASDRQLVRRWLIYISLVMHIQPSSVLDKKTPEWCHAGQFHVSRLHTIELQTFSTLYVLRLYPGATEYDLLFVDIKPSISSFPVCAAVAIPPLPTARRSRTGEMRGRKVCCLMTCQSDPKDMSDPLYHMAIAPNVA